LLKDCGRNDEHPDPNSPQLWYSTHVKNFSLLPASHHLPNGAKTGLSFTSFAINPTLYLTHLLGRAKRLGAQTITAELPPSKGLAHAVSTALDLLPKDASNDVIVVNSTGLAAKDLCPDTDMHPIRGQTLLVRITPPPATTRIMLHDSTPVTYIVPRTGTQLYFLGGTNDADTWDALPTPSITTSILARCKELMKNWVAEDARVELVKEQVGLRPARKGGVRVEVEHVQVEVGAGKRNVFVVHQYGHAGAGYQSSVGSAGKVLRLVEEVCLKVGVPS
jgi:D-amino-acid oxidase